MYLVGVDIGGTSIKFGVMDEDGTLYDKWSIPTDKTDDGAYVLPEVAASILEKLTEKKISPKEVKGIGVGVPGPVDHVGLVQRCVNIGWGVMDVSKQLEGLTGIPVKTGNDANVAALGEAWKGSGQGFQNLVMVTIGTGVGAGVIFHGKIFSGTHGIAGELGHITVNPKETIACNCGRYGCLEQYASATGLCHTAHRFLAEGMDSPWLLEKSSFTGKDIVDGAKEGDALCLTVLEDMGKWLGLGLSHISCILDPDAYVIGGGISEGGDIVLKSIEKHYRFFAFQQTKDASFLARLGNDAGIFGAAGLWLS